MSSDILAHTEAGVCTITFNRLDKKNSITSAMYAALADALDAAQADAAVRCVVFQGHETIFSAGNDIADFLNQWLPDLQRDHRSYVTVAIGCTGGQHRSVYLVEKLTAEFAATWQARSRHREL